MRGGYTPPPLQPRRAKKCILCLITLPNCYQTSVAFGFPRFADKNFCASYPCKNGATCAEISGSYKCVCAKGFLGPVCEGEYLVF